MKKSKLAVVGATGVVGRKILKILEEENLIFDDYILFASKKSAGKNIAFKNKLYEVQELKEDSFKEKIDYAIFSAGSDVAKKYATIAAKNGTIVIDNSNAFRMDKNVPLIVPEVNEEEISKNKGIIANPNCSTIQAVVALAPLDKKYKIKRIVYSTYQAVSGAGKEGINDLKNGIKNVKYTDDINVCMQGSYELKKFNYPIFNNCIPQIDIFESDGYTKEEHKMINETRKILGNDKIQITATAVRVPIFNSHCEAINVEFENKIDIIEVKEILKKSKNIEVIDDIKNMLYPLPMCATETNRVYVGRIRKDDSKENCINLWVVADNIRKGAAFNAVQILEKLVYGKN